jgi:hypothetical protein
MKQNKKITFLLPLVSIFFIAFNTNATLMKIDFSGTGGTLTDGTTYSLSGSYTSFGTGVQLNNQFVTITFSSAVNLLFQSNSSDGKTWNNPADGIVKLAVDGGGVLSLISDVDNEIATISNDGTSNLDLSFRYNLDSGNNGPNGNDYIAANQNWSFSGNTGSTFTISQLNAIIPNTNSFEVLAEAAQVPEPSTLAIFALGMIGLVSRRYKKHF